MSVIETNIVNPIEINITQHKTPEYILKCKRRHYERHKDYYQCYYETNKERYKTYYLENKERLNKRRAELYRLKKQGNNK